MKFDHLTATPTLREIPSSQFLKLPKMTFLAILETVNLEFWYIRDFKVAQIYQNHNSEPLKLQKMTLLDRLNSPKFDFT